MEIVPFIPSVVVANEAHTITEESSYWEDAADLLPVFSSAFPSLGPFAFDKEIMALRIKARKASKEFLELQLEAHRVCKKFADLKKNPKDGGSPYRLMFRIMTCLLISKQFFSVLLSLFIICPNKEEKLSPLKVNKVVRGIFPSDEMFVDYNTIRSGRIILIICGDFNVVKGPGEKIRGVIPTTYFTKDFVDCCNALNLSDAPCVGNFFTWTNGKVKAKLDRVMIDPNWSDGIYNCWVEYKDFEWISDHCPTIIKLFGSREAEKQ
nr:Endonuclease/exonuclease/phosphatase protein [Ipomoea batatas]